MKFSITFAASCMAVSTLLLSTMVVADTKAEIDVSVHETLRQFDALNRNNGQLLHSAAGVLTFPHVTKAGAGIGGEYGEGALQIGGKIVGYYSVTSASIGLTFGAAKRSEVIVFTTQDALDKFTSSKGWSATADAGVAVASNGAAADYDSKTVNKPVIVFVFGEKGLIGDLSLAGSKIKRIEK